MPGLVAAILSPIQAYVALNGVLRACIKGARGSLATLAIKTGKVLWKHSLPVGPVRWVVAIDRNGRVLVSLRDGRVICFAGNE